MQIEVVYRRNGTTYSGALFKQPGYAFDKFDGQEFSYIISKLHTVLAESRDTKDTIVFTREEGKHLFPYNLSEDMVELIRVDPLTAIRHMSPPPVTVVVRDRPSSYSPDKSIEEQDTDPDEITMSSLQVGHATLADAFGDYVYIQARTSTAECPGCGRWAHLAAPGVLICSNCGLKIDGEPAGDTWWRVKTRDLIESGEKKFYIPRTWNNPGPWISRRDLSQLFLEYEQEKRTCLGQETDQ